LKSDASKYLLIILAVIFWGFSLQDGGGFKTGRQEAIKVKSDDKKKVVQSKPRYPLRNQISSKAKIEQPAFVNELHEVDQVVMQLGKRDFDAAGRCRQ